MRPWSEENRYRSQSEGRVEGRTAHGKILVTLEDPFPAYAYREPGG
ncbi:MAG: hypothetical protein ACK41C_12780 [Phenylobacterium sp.]